MSAKDMLLLRNVKLETLIDAYGFKELKSISKNTKLDRGEMELSEKLMFW